MPFPRAPGRRNLLLSVTGVVAVAAAALTAVLWPRAQSCTVDEHAAATCGIWWGAALNATDGSLPAAVRAREQSTARRLDIVHTYHRWTDTFPTASETALARSGRILLLNWEPVTGAGVYLSWGSIARGAHDAQIDALARRISALPAPVLVSFSHEPELHYRDHGASAADFAAAFRHVHDRMRADGARNVRWVWDVMGLNDPVWLDRYRTLWPGDSYVDWVAWDPYNWGSCRSRPWRTFAQTVSPFYDWLVAHGMGNRPFMLAEYGSVEQQGEPAGKAEWYAGIPDALRALPRLRALVYFDVPAPPANCDWQVSTSSPATAAFDRLARNAIFAPTARYHLGLFG